MSGNENTKEFRMKFVDKLIVSLIGIASFAVIIVTIISVNYKYQKLAEKKLAELDEIPYNETYKYQNNGKSISFYKGIKIIGEYECASDCKISDFRSNQFIVDNDDLIPIMDDGQFHFYSITKGKNAIVLDDIPQTSINNKYGVIRIDGLAGVINKKGQIIVNCNYDDIDINISHIVTLKDLTIYVFDNNANLLVSKPILADGDLSISEKNNNMYINIVGENTTTLIFDTRTNTFLN